MSEADAAYQQGYSKGFQRGRETDPAARLRADLEQLSKQWRQMAAAALAKGAIPRR